MTRGRFDPQNTQGRTDITRAAGTRSKKPRYKVSANRQIASVIEVTRARVSGYVESEKRFSETRALSSDMASEPRNSGPRTMSRHVQPVSAAPLCEADQRPTPSCESFLVV